MPVDLTVIPGRANRLAPPSIKRWLLFLVGLTAINGVVTAMLWPATDSTHTPLFWFCFPGGAICLWLMMASGRWLIFLASSFSADGWDHAQEEAVSQSISRGQRSLLLLSQVVHLPHMASAGVLSQQLLMHEGIILPSITDSATRGIIRQARFEYEQQPLLDRLLARLRALLLDDQLHAAFVRLGQHAPIEIAVQIGPDLTMTPEQHLVVQQVIKETIAFPLHIAFVNGQGLECLDRWLDEPSCRQTLLVIAVNLVDKVMEGAGDAAVALLIQFGGMTSTSYIASLHRPEQTKESHGIKYALQQALLWGGVTSDEINHIWLTGAGTGNKAEGIFSAAGMQFKKAGHPCDIDARTGLTGVASPWLAIAATADNVAITAAPQLLMSVPEERLSPWFMVVRCPLT